MEFFSIYYVNNVLHVGYFPIACVVLLIVALAVNTLGD